MKKVTLFIAAFIMAVGAFAQEDCSKEVSAPVDVENGWGNLHSLIFANDFKVEENETFNLTNIEFNALTEPGQDITGLTLYFYEDTGGNGPGNELGMQEIDEVETELLGEAFGFNRSTISFDLNEPFEYEGSENGTTTYWTGIVVDYGGESSYMEVTTAFDTDNAAYFFDPDAQQWIDGASLNGFEEFAHGVISLYGSCSPMGVEDFAMESFTHFIQNDQMTLESAGQIQEVAIYNLLGQEVIAENINATSGNINLGSLNAGVYLTKVNVDGNTKTFKFSIN